MNTTKADYWTDTRIGRDTGRDGIASEGGRRGIGRKRGGHGTRDYNQDSKTQSCRFGANSGLASKMVLNFPKMDETRLGDKEENEKPKACYTLSAVAAVRLRLFPRLISPRSASISKSLAEDSPLPLLPSPPAIWAWNPPPLFRLRPLPPVVAPELPYGNCVEVRGRGNGEGNSSIESECGLTSGPTVTGPGAVPFGVVVRGECGGDPPSWFRSFRVICGRDCESRVTSGTRRLVRESSWRGPGSVRTSNVSLSIFFFPRPSPSFFDPL